ncbi:hypothetical protein FACUT_104 [Fusarium acutatum]|uniref:Uncharacterized protein n=1 Tax=Fusarium acutatum TaxID=78861 RepID=A0A8H4K5R4_9HYPO|nr:hypothetical protein FACUT_104 [Fusarium acutatum]
MNPSRPQQRGRLALLSTEIFLQITGESGRDGGTLPYKDLKGLAVSCSKLFHLIRQMYYFADGCAVFHSAVAHGDLEAIHRCTQLGAAPRTMRTLPHGCKYFTCGSPPIGKFLNRLKWLLDESSEANDLMDQP